MNKVVLMGRLTADPELQMTTSNIAVCKFTVAINRRYSKEENKADFIRCIAWRKTAEFVSRYFSKGKMIALDGMLQTGSYTDNKYADVTHYTTDVLVENVEFVGSKNDTDSTPARQAAESTSSESLGDLGDFEEVLSDGDVPF